MRTNKETLFDLIICFILDGVMIDNFKFHIIKFN